jgi:hypothetical protein
VFQIIEWACRACEVQDVIDWAVNLQWFRDIVFDEPELGIVQQRRDVPPVAGQEVVNAQDLVTVRQKPFAEMRADEPGASGNNSPHDDYSHPSYEDKSKQ